MAPLFFSGGGGDMDEQTWMSPSLRCDLNKPLGLGLAEGGNDAIFTLSSQILSEFDDGANSSRANLIFVINVLAGGEGWA